FQKQLVESGMSETNAILMSALTNNTDEAFALSEDEWFAQARKLMVQLVDTFSSKPDDVYLFIHQHWIPHFKERTQQEQGLDRKSTRLNSSHVSISYAVFCLQKKKSRAR